MKRDLKLQGKTLQKVVDYDHSRMRFETFSFNDLGYEDVEYPLWERDEAHHVGLLVQEGFLEKEKLTDAPWLGDGHSDAYAETYVFLTPRGYDWLENRGVMKKLAKNVYGNIPTVIVSVVSALLIAWLLSVLELPTDPTNSESSDKSVSEDSARPWVGVLRVL